MDIPTKNLLKGMATVLLIPIDLYYIIWFSIFGSLGAMLAIFGSFNLTHPVFDDDTMIPIFAIVIGLIIIVPIVRLVWKNRQNWSQVVFKSLLFLLFYLIIGIGTINIFMFMLSLDLSVMNNEGFLQIYCQIVSLFLAIGYFFYFKKVIKPRSLKS